MRHTHVLPFVSLLLGACIGEIGDAGTGPAAAANAAGARADTAGDVAIAALCTATYAPGHVPVHRLTNEEYSNTVRDLLHTKTRPGDAFTPSAVGLSGFSNDSDSLPISDENIAAYYSAAEALAKEVLASKATANGAYSQIVTCAPSASCAQTIISTLGAHAYRRPLTDAEATGLTAVFTNQADFDTGIGDVIIALLVSPKFIFVHTTDAVSRNEGAVFPIDGYAVASRLSYALWQTMPDEQLFQLAHDGKLNDPTVVQQQAMRMLKDAKVDTMLTSLRNDWAGLAAMADPAGKLPGLDDGLRASMVGEVQAFLRDVVTNDRSFLTVLTGGTTLVDQSMATYYGVTFPAGSDPKAFVSAPLPQNRKGLATSAAVLTNTAGDATFTHPVHRGKWVANKILCTDIAPPPNNAPVSVDPAKSGGASPRQLLEQHVANPACIGCHKVMDTVGIGLENYDPFGKWRDSYPSALAIDASGTLPDGKSFQKAPEMVDDIAADGDTRACLARQVLGYVLTRALRSNDDLCVTKAIGNASVTETGTFSDLMTKIVGSRQFFMQTGEAP